MPISNDFQTLLTLSEAYDYLGYSVIPLLGDRDPSRPKVPAIPWAGFQTYRSSTYDHQQWFTQDGFAGLGIVTGRISKLVVLDFDSEPIFNDFKLKYPDLLETHTVRSAGRQLPHLYFKLPDHLSIASIKGQGIDLLSDGRYVVAPPTAFNGQSYKITRGGMPKILSERDIRRIQAFLSAYKPAPKPIVVTGANSVGTRHAITEPRPKPTEKDLERLYLYYCKQGGRNEALFRTSLYARDTGWTQEETLSSLAAFHMQQATPSSSSKETPAHRQREAQKTIMSAFSRPARPTKSRARSSSVQLSNSVREAFIQHGMTSFVRTYEGLLHRGVQPGQFILTKQTVDLLKGLVGRDSVLTALKAKHEGKPLFAPVSPHYAVATDNPLNLSKNASLIERKNQEKPQGGRPSHAYQMPSNHELCRLLGVELTSSDVLEHDDYASARKTRMSLHRELIKRRPGQYPRRWLARRLGITRRTLDTYNRLLPIKKLKMFFETRITWNTIERLPFDEPLQGAFLETAHGKKYPALRTIASRLLASGEGVCLKQHAPNFYSYGQEEPVLKRLQLQEAIQNRQEKIESFIAQKEVALQSRPLLPEPPPASRPKPKLSRQNFHNPFKDTGQEAQAQALYNRLNQMQTKQISLVNARRLVATYDAQSLSIALDRLTTFKSLTNPTGLLITLLRSPAHH